MQKMLKIADAIFKTKQNRVKRIWPLERAPAIYLGYELISKTSKLKLDGFSIDRPHLSDQGTFTPVGAQGGGLLGTQP